MPPSTNSLQVTVTHIATHCQSLQHTLHTLQQKPQLTSSTHCNALQQAAEKVEEQLVQHTEALHAAAHELKTEKQQRASIEEEACTKLKQAEETAVLGRGREEVRVLHCVAVCCTVLWCSALQYVAVCCSTRARSRRGTNVAMLCSALQYVVVLYAAVCCSVLQYLVLLYVAVCCSSLQ